jgi:hypothetical protein
VYGHFCISGFIVSQDRTANTMGFVNTVGGFSNGPHADHGMIGSKCGLSMLKKNNEKQAIRAVSRHPCCRPGGLTPHDVSNAPQVLRRQTQTQ